MDRPSLNKSIEQRYADQHVGGAFDAKKPTPAETFGTLEKTWTKPGFVNAIDNKLGMAGSKQLRESIYLKGFDNQRYK
jgi:hypothetical protein